MSIALILVSMSFSVPETFYSPDKTFIKSPPAQSDFFSFSVNDLEDTDDISPDLISIEFAQIDFSFSNGFDVKNYVSLAENITKSNAIYLRHRKLLI